MNTILAPQAKRLIEALGPTKKFLLAQSHKNPFGKITIVTFLPKGFLMQLECIKHILYKICFVLMHHSIAPNLKKITYDASHHKLNKTFN